MKVIVVMMIFMYVSIHSIESNSFKRNKIIITKRFCNNNLWNHNYNYKFDNLRDVVNDGYDNPVYHVNILNNNNDNNNFLNVRMFISLSIVMTSILFNPTYSYAGI